MTRKQVADRLGRSLATVRRLEGSILHPRRDSRGVHHFDRNEVESLARDLDAGRVSLARDRGSVDQWEGQRTDDVANGDTSGLQEQIYSLAAELEDLRRTHRRDVEALQAESEQAQSLLRDELTSLTRELADFASTVERALG